MTRGRLLVLVALLVACADAAPVAFDGGPCWGHVKVRCACPRGAVGLEVCADDGGRLCACP